MIKRKLITLLSLLIVAVIGARAQETFGVSWEMGENTVGVAAPATIANDLAYNVGAGLLENGTKATHDIVFTKLDMNASGGGDKTLASAKELEKYIDFSFKAEEAVTLSSIGFDLVKFGTNDPTAWVALIDSEENETLLLSEAVVQRDSEEGSTRQTCTTTATVAAGDVMTLRIYIGKLNSGKSVGIANVSISGVIGVNETPGPDLSECVTETFAKYTELGTQNGSAVDSKMDEVSDLAGWTGSKVYAVYNAENPGIDKEGIRIGTGSAAGSITSPALGLDAENVKVTFKYGKHDSGALVNVTVEGGTIAAQSISPDVESYILIAGATAETKVTFANEDSKQRFYLRSFQACPYEGEMPELTKYYLDLEKESEVTTYEMVNGTFTVETLVAGEYKFYITNDLEGSQWWGGDAVSSCEGAQYQTEDTGEILLILTEESDVTFTFDGEHITIVVEPTVETVKDVTVAEAIEVANGLASNATTTKLYRITATVKKINNTETNILDYGNINMDVEDETGEITVFRAKYLDNESFTSSDQIPAVGTKLVLVGNIQNYKGNTPEIVNGYIEQILETPQPAEGLTFYVTVPEGTPAVYIAGSWNWEEFVPMTKVDDTHYTVTIENANADAEYKYLCGENWNYVEVNAEGIDIGNRTFTATAGDEVARWNAIPGVYYLTGDGDYFGGWDAQALMLKNGAYTIKNLPKGTYLFKVTDGANQWFGCTYLNTDGSNIAVQCEESATSVGDVNCQFTIGETMDVTIGFDGQQITVNVSEVSDCMTETFSKILEMSNTPNGTTIDNKMDEYCDLAGWTGVKANAVKDEDNPEKTGLRIGTSSAAGSVTSPVIAVEGENVKVTFVYTKYESASVCNVTVEGGKLVERGEDQPVSDEGAAYSSYESYVLISELTADTKVTFANEGGKQRFYLRSFEACPYNGEVPQVNYYLTGDCNMFGNWDATALPMVNDEYTFEQLPAGGYQFKITDGTWNNSWGKDNVGTVAGARTVDYSDEGNVYFVIVKTSDVTISFDGENINIAATPNGNSYYSRYARNDSWQPKNYLPWDCDLNAYVCGYIVDKDVSAIEFPFTFSLEISDDAGQTLSSANVSSITGAELLDDSDIKFVVTQESEVNVLFDGENIKIEVKPITTYYLTGEGDLFGSWGETELPMVNDEYTFEQLPAGTYLFKITDGEGNWFGCSYLNAEASNLEVTCGENDNCQFTIDGTMNVTIAFDGQSITVNAETVEPVMASGTVDFYVPGENAVASTADAYYELPSGDNGAQELGEYTKEAVTVKFVKGGSNASMAYSGNPPTARWYAQNSIEITVKDYTLTKVEFMSQYDNGTLPTASEGTVTGEATKDGVFTWTGAITDGTLTLTNGSSKQLRFSHMIVTYTDGDVPQPQGITFNVTVPEGTPAVYIAGSWDWNTFVPMTKVDDTHYTVTIENANEDVEYKYLCSDDWQYREVNAEGNDIDNRTLNPTAGDEVARWNAIPGEVAYYVIGDGELFGNWDVAHALLIENGSYTFQSLPAGTYKFKVTDGNQYWKGCSIFDAESSNIELGCEEIDLDPDGNLVLSLNEPMKVIIGFDGQSITVNVDAAEPVSDCLTETFAKYTELGSKSGSDVVNKMDEVSDIAGWTGVKVFAVYDAENPGIDKEGIRIGTGSAAGSITSPALGLDAENVKVTFKYVKHESGALVNVSVEGGTIVEQSIEPDVDSYVIISGATAETKVTFANEESKQRFYLKSFEACPYNGEEPQGNACIKNEDQVVVFFNADNGWTSVNAYAWSNEVQLLGNWPGTPAEKIADNLYQMEFPASVGTPTDSWQIIWNDGTYQTADLPFNNHYMYSIDGPVSEITDICESPAETMTITVRVQEGMDAPYIYSWDEVGPVVDWPGELMQLIDEDLYAYTMPKGNSFLFHGGGNTFTDEISGVNEDKCYTLDANFIVTEGCDEPQGITFNVEVPQGTPAVYIAGSWDWNTFVPMTKVDDTHYTVTIENANDDTQYKYLCGEDWMYREVKANGEDLDGNRIVNPTAGDVVEAWLNIPGVEPEKTYYIAGEKLVGSWNPNAMLMENGSATFTNLAADTYEFKITANGTWAENWGYESIGTTEGVVIPEGYNGGNAIFTISTISDVTISFDGQQISIVATKAPRTAISESLFVNFSELEEGQIAESQDFNNIGIISSGNKLWTVDSNDKVYDCGTMFTKRLKSGGKATADGRYLTFDVADACTIEFYAMSSNKAEVRDFNIVLGEYASDPVATLTVGGEELETVIYTYEGQGPATLFVVPQAGINFYGLSVIFNNEHPAQRSYYITGETLVGSWEADAQKLEDCSFTASGLEANTYRFKITDGTWANNWGADKVVSVVGATLADDGDNNAAFTLDVQSDVTISFRGGKIYIAAEPLEEPCLTYTVEVPAGTPSVFIAGQWDNWTSFTELTKVDDTHFSVCLDNATPNHPYKYCWQADWKYEELTAEGAPGPDRSYAELDKVVAWRTDAVVNTMPQPISGLVYNGEAQALVEDGSVQGGYFVYSLDGETYSQELPRAIAAGEYHVSVMVYGDDTHNGVELDLAPFVVEIARAEATYAAPQPVEGLVYNGRTQTLITAGNVVGGQMLYSLDDEEFSAALPKGENAGIYHVFYRIDADENHNSIGSQLLEVEIARADIHYTAPQAIEGLVFNDELQVLVTAGDADFGEMLYLLSGEDEEFTNELPEAYRAGVYEVFYRIEGDENHNSVEPQSLQVEIAKADIIYKEPTAVEGLVYTGETQTLINPGFVVDGGIMRYSHVNDPNYFSTNLLAGTNAGDYEVFYRIDADGNHNSVEPQSFIVTIAKATPQYTAPQAIEGLVYDGDMQVLITACVAEHGHVLYSLGGDMFTQYLPKAVDAGVYDVYFRIDGDLNYANVEPQLVQAEIAKADIEYTAPQPLEGLVYTGNPQALIAAGSVVEGGTMLYSLNGQNFSAELPEATNVGVYEVYYRIDADDDNYNSVAAQLVGSVEIARADVNYVAPRAIRGLVYNGEAQQLVTLGTAEGGQFYYWLEGEEMSTTRPTATDAGDYTVHFMLVGDAAHNNIEFNPLTVTIAKADLEYTSPVGNEGLVYNGDPQELIFPGMVEEGGTMLYSLDGGEFTEALPEAIEAGTYMIEYRVDAADNNHNGVAAHWLVVEIARADLEYTAPQPLEGLVYTGNPQALIAAGSVEEGGTMLYSLNGQNFSDALPEATNVGVYEVYYRIDADENHNSVASQLVGRVEIARADVDYVAPRAIRGLVYNGEAQQLVTLGTAEGGQFYYWLEGEEMSTTRPTATDAGDYTVHFMLVGDAAHNNIEFEPVVVTIAKADIEYTAPQPIEGLVYNGEAQTLIVAGQAASGVMMYALEGNRFSTSLPTAVADGLYTVLFRIDAADDNHNSVAAQELQVRISANKAALEQLIGEANEFHGSISNLYPEIANELKSAINDAQQVDNDIDATQEEVDDAYDKLRDALEKARRDAELAAQAITIYIPAGEFATGYYDHAITITDPNVELYTITSIDDDAVYVTELTVAAPNTPVLIYNPNSFDVIVTLEATDATPTDVTPISQFKGTLVELEMPGSNGKTEYYIFNGTAFVYVAESGTMPANKCWLELTAGSGNQIRHIMFGPNGGPTTGLENAGADEVDGPWFDLNGRLLGDEEPDAEGIFIHNGKKVLLRRK